MVREFGESRRCRLSAVPHVEEEEVVKQGKLPKTIAQYSHENMT